MIGSHISSAISPLLCAGLKKKKAEPVSYAVRIRASDSYFSMPKMKASAVHIRKIRAETKHEHRFENPMAHVPQVLAPKSDDLGHQIFKSEKKHGLQIQDVIQDSKQQQNDRRVGC